MLRWAVIFLIIALVAGALGMFHVAGISMEIAEILALIFVVLFVISLFMHFGRGRGAPPAV